MPICFVGGEIDIFADALTAKALLEEEDLKNQAFPIINLALVHAAGFECPEDWSTAISLVARLGRIRPESTVQKQLRNIVSWWHDLSYKSDGNDIGEGNLVLGLLAREGLIDGAPDGVDWKSRLEQAREHGWRCPDWLFHKR